MTKKKENNNKGVRHGKQLSLGMYSRVGRLRQGSILGCSQRDILTGLICGKWLCLSVLGRKGTGLRGIKVIGDFKINKLYMGVNLAHQLPYVRGVLLIGGARLIINGGRKWGEGNLLQMP